MRAMARLGTHDLLAAAEPVTRRSSKQTKELKIAKVRYITGAALLGVAQWAWALHVPGPVVDGDWLCCLPRYFTAMKSRSFVR